MEEHRPALPATAMPVISPLAERSELRERRSCAPAKRNDRNHPESMTRNQREHPALRLPPFDPESGSLNAIVETPRQSRSKFSYDPHSWLYKLSAVLPEGLAFPHAFGFVPSTLGDDGDPLDVLLLMDEAVFPGCLVPSRLVGVIEARQTERDGTVNTNDRLVAVAVDSRAYADVKRPQDLGEAFIEELEQFFVFYNEGRGKQFESRGWKGARVAARLIAEGESRHRRRTPR
jgi:inorganic pyrophosphatase